MSKLYTFDKQLTTGKMGEKEMDTFYSKHHTVLPGVEKDGYDRVFVNDDGYSWTVEYKTDFMSQDTGNLFVETVSVDINNTPGWVYSSKAIGLYWLIWDTKTVLEINLRKIRIVLPVWNKLYRSNVPVSNEGYNTLGTLVPVNECKRIAQRITKLQGGK